jgi:tRNA dimethylallyltransferase
MVAVLGPTGSGKSELAIEIALAFDGEVVNCDSLQVFRHFDIGTAKMPLAERRGVQHHMIDVADPDEIFTAGDFARRARPVLDEISARGHLPIVAGGTGFYVRALIDGLFEGPSRDEELRARLARREERRPGSLHRLLSRFDRTTAARIHRNDVPKVMRALEVCLLSRRPVSELHQEGRDALTGYRTLKLGLLPDRDELYDRLNERCARMFGTGLVEEVRHILALGYNPAIKPFESHGYKQALQQLSGELTPKEAIFYAQRNTRNYAKRQITWFRREPGLNWLKGFASAEAIKEQALSLTAAFLSSPADSPPPAPPAG